MFYEVSIDRLGSRGKNRVLSDFAAGSVQRRGAKLRHSPERGLAGTERGGPEPNVIGVCLVGLRFFPFQGLFGCAICGCGFAVCILLTGLGSVLETEALNGVVVCRTEVLEVMHSQESTAEC